MLKESNLQTITSQKTCIARTRNQSGSYVSWIMNLDRAHWQWHQGVINKGCPTLSTKGKRQRSTSKYGTCEVVSVQHVPSTPTLVRCYTTYLESRCWMRQCQSTLHRNTVNPARSTWQPNLGFRTLQECGLPQGKMGKVIMPNADKKKETSKVSNFCTEVFYGQPQETYVNITCPQTFLFLYNMILQPFSLGIIDVQSCTERSAGPKC